MKTTKITVREAVLLAFNEMGDKFPIIKLNDRVRYLRGQYYLQDDTIKRRLRELKENEVINFHIVDYVKCIYEKLKIGDLKGYKNNPKLYLKHNKKINDVFCR